MTTTVVFILLLALVFFLAIAIFFVRRANHKRLPPPSPRQVLVPANEQLFMQQVDERLGKHCWLFWNVTLLDLLRIGTGTPWNEYEKRNLLLERRFSCVICSRDDFSIQGIVDFVPDNRQPFDAPELIVPKLKLDVVTVTEKDLDEGAFESLLLTGFPHLESLLSVDCPQPSVVNFRR